MKVENYCIKRFLFLGNVSSSMKPTFLVQGRKGIGKNSIINALVSKLGIQTYKIECSDIQTNTSAQTESKLKNVFSKSKLCAPCLLILNNFEVSEMQRIYNISEIYKTKILTHYMWD